MSADGLCKKCGTSERYSDGRCKHCRLESNRRWKRANPEKNRECSRLWRKANPEKNREKKRLYREENQEKVRAGWRRWYKNNTERHRENVLKWQKDNPGKAAEKNRRWREKNGKVANERARRRYKKNPEKKLKSIRRWREKNREKHCIYEHNRRARLRGNGGSHTSAEWKAVKKGQGGRCLACGQRAKLEADHVIPVALGGKNDISNIQGLCRSCNASKGARIIDYRLGEIARER